MRLVSPNGLVEAAPLDWTAYPLGNAVPASTKSIVPIDGQGTHFAVACKS